MRAKRRNVCQQCRSRKLGCDGKAPACGQCTLRQLSCSGYPRNFVFLSPPSNSALKLSASEKCEAGSAWHANSTSAELQPPIAVIKAPSGIITVPALLNKSGLLDDVRFIVEHYTPTHSDVTAEFNPWHNQICGAWVEALPLLFTKGQIPNFLASSITAFAAALRHPCVGSNAVPPQVLELYGISLDLLAGALKNASGLLQVEHCAAIMCLTVTETVFPTSRFSWMEHAAAVGHFIERLGPNAFTSGILHKLFVGFRPLLLKSAIFHRRGSFLATAEWTEQPFQGQSISPAQSLFNQAVRLPILLERFDDMMRSPCSSAQVKCRTDLEAFLQRLEDWDGAEQKQSSSPLYWKKPDNGHFPACDVDTIWFKDLMTASSLTFCWAFKIIVLDHLYLLRESADTVCPSQRPHHDARANDSFGREEVITLAEMICNSMPYFIRPEAKLWGHASTFFTFSTSVQAFKNNKEACQPQLLRCQHIFTRLNEMKVYFPGIQELLL